MARKTPDGYKKRRVEVGWMIGMTAQDICAAIIDQTAQLIDPVLVSKHYYYSDTLDFEGFIPLTPEEIAAKNDAAAKKALANERRRLARVERERKRALEIIQEAEKLKKKYPGIASSIGQSN